MRSTIFPALRRRHLLQAGMAGIAARALRAAEGKPGEGSDIARGRFQTPGILTTPQGKVTLTGEEPVQLVLEDSRLNGQEIEVVGTRSGSRFTINPIHLRGIWIYKNNQRLMVTYWCDICYIRTYSPGQCWCCQEETRLDPKDPNSKDPTP